MDDMAGNTPIRRSRPGYGSLANQPDLHSLKADQTLEFVNIEPVIDRFR